MDEEKTETIWETDPIDDLKRQVKELTEQVNALAIEVGTGKPEGLASAIDTKVSEVGGRYWSAQTGARVQILPDDNTGIQIIDDAAADVFKVIVGGTNVGDVIIGNYAGDQGAKYDKSLGTFDFKGAISAASIDIGGDDTTSAHIDADGNQWWGASIANKATAPARISNAGVAHFSSISLDTDVVLADLQAGSAIAVQYLTAGSITSKAITLAVADGTGDSKIQAGKTDFTNAESGFILGIDDSDSDKAKFYIGDSAQYINWDGTTLSLSGDSVNDVVTRAGALFKTGGFIGSMGDGMTEAQTNGTVTRGYLTTCLDAGGATSAYAKISKALAGSTSLITWATPFELVFSLKCISHTPTSPTGFFGFVQTDFIAVSMSTTQTGGHIGVFLSDTAMKSSNADGTTQTINTLTGIASTDLHVYRIKSDGGTSIKFYVDDVLINTHTTNLPSGSTLLTLVMGVSKGDSAGNTNVELFNNYFGSFDII